MTMEDVVKGGQYRVAVMNDHTQGPLRAETANKSKESLLESYVPALNQVRDLCVCVCVCVCVFCITH
jgi:hypothetical protein